MSTDDLAAVLREAIKRLGVTEAARRLSLSPESVLRIAVGGASQEATVFYVRAHLDVLKGDGDKRAVKSRTPHAQRSRQRAEVAR